MMATTIAVDGKQRAQSYFLTELLGARIVLKGRKIGRLNDFVFVESGKIPTVSHLYVGRSFGNPSLLIPWEKVRSLGRRRIGVDIESVKKYEADPGEETKLLKDYILDKKVLDLEGKEVEVVYDVRLILINNRLYVSEVDVSKYGLLRRIGLKRLAEFMYNMADSMRKETVSWAYFQSLPDKIGSFKGDVRLKVLKEKLSQMHPVDLADILERLDQEQRVMVFDELDTSRASDTLEEIDPSVQKAILSCLNNDRITQLVKEMTPGQAADVLAVLPSAEANAVLKLLDIENARKIQAILERHEEKILNYATTNYMRFPPDVTIQQAGKEYRRTVKDYDVIMYLYVVDPDGKLLGVLDVRDMLRANDTALLKDVMYNVVTSLKPTSTLREASAKFTRYGFRAIPVVDDDGKILGVVPYRDMMNLKHRFLE
jgi:magnesium transporter